MFGEEKSPCKSESCAHLFNIAVENAIKLRARAHEWTLSCDRIKSLSRRRGTTGLCELDWILCRLLTSALLARSCIIFHEYKPTYTSESAQESQLIITVLWLSGRLRLFHHAIFIRWASERERAARAIINLCNYDFYETLCSQNNEIDLFNLHSLLFLVRHEKFMSSQWKFSNKWTLNNQIQLCNFHINSSEIHVAFDCGWESDWIHFWFLVGWWVEQLRTP